MQLLVSDLSFKRIVPQRLCRGAVLLLITEVRRALANLYSSLLSDDMRNVLGT